jgi:hypothetical protein
MTVTSRLAVPLALSSAVLAGWLSAAIGEPFLGGALALVGLTIVLPRPYLPPLLLVTALLLGSRTFAYLYLPLGGLPLFVTEGTLAVTFGLVALRTLKVGRAMHPARLHGGLLACLLILTAIASMRDFSGLNTGRNCVVLLYALFYVAPVAIIRHERSLWWSATVFLGAATFRSLMLFPEIQNPGFLQTLPDWMLVIGLGSGVDIMWSAASGLLLLAILPSLRGRIWVAGSLALLACWWVVGYLEIRSAWTGAAFALTVLALILRRYRLILSGHWHMAIGAALLLASASVVLTLTMPEMIVSRLEEVGTLVGADVDETRYTNIKVRFSLWSDMWDEISAGWVSMAMGVGFGRSFVPSIATSLTSPTHGPLAGSNVYAPHNAQLMVLYRVGFVGMAVYLALLFRVMRDGLRALRTGPIDLRLLQAGLLAAFAYAFFHSLTDVVLESPYRGVIYWTLLGFCQATANLLRSRDG